jgi:hypothetical protein
MLITHLITIFRNSDDLAIAKYRDICRGIHLGYEVTMPCFEQIILN